MPMQWDHFEFKIAEHYLPALINADESGMEDDESLALHSFVETACANARASGWTVGHWTDVDGSGDDWGRCEVSGLGAMRCTVRLMVYKP